MLLSISNFRFRPTLIEEIYSKLVTCIIAFYRIIIEDNNECDHEKYYKEESVFYLLLTLPLLYMS